MKQYKTTFCLISVKRSLLNFSIFLTREKSKERRKKINQSSRKISSINRGHFTTRRGNKALIFLILANVHDIAYVNLMNYVHQISVFQFSYLFCVINALKPSMLWSFVYIFLSFFSFLFHHKTDLDIFITCRTVNSNDPIHLKQPYITNI